MRVRIETERLIIRNFVVEDYEDMFTWCGDPEVTRYLTFPTYKCAEDCKKFLETKNPDEKDNYDLAFILKETGKAIGSGGLLPTEEEGVFSLGYCVRKDMWGKGYVPEAIEAIVDYVQKTRGIKELEGLFAEENKQSQRVMEKLGMSYFKDSEYDKLDKSAHYKAKIYKKTF